MVWFLVSGLTLVWLWISTPNFSGKILMYMGKSLLIFSTSFSKWLPGGHIRFFGFWMAWFRQCNSSLLWNFSFKFMCMSFVAVGSSLTIVSYVAFKMTALWFLTMLNCNPPIAHCHPLLWGGGILVEHWSTISSFTRRLMHRFHLARFFICIGCDYCCCISYNQQSQI